MSFGQRFYFIWVLLFLFLIISNNSLRLFYPLFSLIDAYKRCLTLKEGENLVADLKYNQSGRFV